MQNVNWLMLYFSTTPLITQNIDILEYPLFLFGGIYFLISVICSFLFLSHLGLYGIFFLNLSGITIFWFTLIPYAYTIFVKNITYKLILGQWFFLNHGVKVNFELYIDALSYSFMLLTTTIGIFVYLYAFSYFRYEPLVERFLNFLCSFILSMLLLVSSGNIIILFLGWELIGLTSFFLINFWVTRVGTLKAAFKAFSFNKVSDYFILILIFIFYNIIYDFDIVSINSQAHLYYNHTVKFLHYNINLVEVISFCILGAAFIKSAQLGAHIWLPDSMEAPVPASALIHSATLVSAGIFLILRFYPIIEFSYYSKLILPIMGSITAAYGGIVASYQADVKRILAYSTISHCGFLMLLCSFNVQEYTILYLYVHGFFKAAVFMCVGNVIRISKNYQDFRRMGMFSKYLPFECFCAFICLFNLAGLPFSIGFFIKHLIALGLSSSIWIYYFVSFNVFLGSISGLFYSYRLLFFVFFDFKKGQKSLYKHINNNNYMSYFYSNSSLASNVAITGLVLTSYLVCFQLYCYFYINYCTHSDLTGIYNTSNFFNLFKPIEGLLMNLSYLNWVVIALVFNFIFLYWQREHNPHEIYNMHFDYIYLSIFFFMNIYYLF